MTPSDKKRMMDQNHKKVSVPELKPENKRMQIIEKTANLINLKNLNKSILIEKPILIVMNLMA